MTTQPPPIIGIEDLEVSYGAINALRGLSLEVREGEIVSLLGPNGGGKTTLLRTVMGLLRPRSGSIRLDGKAIAGRRTEDIARLGVAVVPEGRGILAGMSVRDNLAMGAYVRRASKTEVDAGITEVVGLFPILGEKLDVSAANLSGGQKQMLLIARCLMARPRLLLLDEPSLGLAPIVVRSVFDSISKLRDEHGLSVLLAEQNARAALRVTDRGYVLDRGEIVLVGSGAELARSPELTDAYLGGPTSPGPVPSGNR